MCVLALAWRAHPRWRLVLAGNRDEFHARAAAPLGRWVDAPGILAGRDLTGGGTWLGVAEAGRLAVVTNLRGHGAPAPDKASRGQLVRDLLAGEGAYADPSIAQLADFNPFNLIAVDAAAGGTGAHFLTNRPEPRIVPLGAGLYGLSNGALDEPWPKTLRLKERLLGWLTGDADDPHALFDALREEAVPAAGLPPAAPSDVAREPRDSAVFIRDPIYGTRCSTVVTVDAEGRGTIRERRFDAAGDMTGESAEAFAWRA